MSEEKPIHIFRIVGAEKRVYIKKEKRAGKITVYFSWDGAPSDAYRKYYHESDYNSLQAQLSEARKLIVDLWGIAREMPTDKRPKNFVDVMRVCHQFIDTNGVG